VSEQSLLAVEDLHVVFRQRSLLTGSREVHAVNGASFEIAAGETVGLVGESGSGKSTTARALLHLVQPSGGRMTWRGEDVTHVKGRALRTLRRDLQMVFQDPYSSLDPSMVVGDIVAEPLVIHSDLGRKERYDRAADALAQVGLARHHMQRYSYEFSGGQRQRIAIARALVVSPAFIACDEVVSALDVSIQGQVVNLLLDLQAAHGISYLFITHNLAVVRHVSTRIAVMYLGEVVEIGPSERVYNAPAHPYTQALLSAIADVQSDATRRRERIILSGELPDPAAPPAGCKFHTRCPLAMEVCSQERPRIVEVEGGGNVSCHLHTSGPSLNGAPLSELRAAKTVKQGAPL
jgi:peptide/nickel transport system ATP-binding protein